MSTGIAITLVAAVAAVLALWLAPLLWLAQKIDAQRDHLDNKIDKLSAQQREDYKDLSSKIDRVIWHQTRGTREMEAQP